MSYSINKYWNLSQLFLLIIIVNAVYFSNRLEVYFNNSIAILLLLTGFIAQVNSGIAAFIYVKKGGKGFKMFVSGILIIYTVFILFIAFLKVGDHAFA